MAVKAIAKGVRMSPRKVGVVAALVRGRSVDDALVILEHTPRRSALPVQKVIASAKANAEHNHNYKANTLQITEISVTPGPREQVRENANEMRDAAEDLVRRIRGIFTS